MAEDHAPTEGWRGPTSLSADDDREEPLSGPYPRAAIRWPLPLSRLTLSTAIQELSVSGGNDRDMTDQGVSEADCSDYSKRMRCS